LFIMAITLHEGDLPANLSFGTSVAIDTETMGLNPHRDRLCLVQISAGDGDAHLVQIVPGQPAPRLAAVLADPKLLKIFHFARFDLATIRHHLGVMTTPVYCTKMASRLVRTFTDRFSSSQMVCTMRNIQLSSRVPGVHCSMRVIARSHAACTRSSA